MLVSGMLVCVCVGGFAAAAVFAPMQYYYLYISEWDNTNLAALER